MDNFVETVLPIIAVVAIVLAILAYAVFLNRKVNRVKGDVRRTELADRRSSTKVGKVSGFAPPKIRAFYDALRTAMPSNYIIIPNIAVELLFQSANRKDLGLEGQYANFCIFTEALAPILVIDLKDFSYAPVISNAFIIPEKVKDLIRSAGIPVMTYDIRDSYNIDDLRRTIAKSMNPLIK